MIRSPRIITLIDYKQVTYDALRFFFFLTRSCCERLKNDKVEFVESRKDVFLEVRQRKNKKYLRVGTHIRSLQDLMSVAFHEGMRSVPSCRRNSHTTHKQHARRTALLPSPPPSKVAPSSQYRRRWGSVSRFQSSSALRRGVLMLS